MTATEELRKLLDERGVEYTTDDGRFAKVTKWLALNGRLAVFAEYDSGELRFAMDSLSLTPEQAIAATLGSGKLTAEQVWRAVDQRSVCVPEEGDEEWQAIADELNAAMDGGECEIVEHYASSTRGEIGRERVKLSCGHIVERHSKFCQECGHKIREAVKR